MAAHVTCYEGFIQSATTGQEYALHLVVRRDLAEHVVFPVFLMSDTNTHPAI